MRVFVLILSAVLVAGCASIELVPPGRRTVGGRLSLEAGTQWNHLNFPVFRPATVWTIDGLPIDELLIYPGIASGQPLMGSSAGRKAGHVFRAGMDGEALVALFEGVLSQDGSTLTIERIEPALFAGSKGVRWFYTRTRKGDGLIQRGIGYASVGRDELYAMLFHAPRLAFFARHQSRIEALAASARVE